MAKFMMPQTRTLPCFESLFVLQPLLHSESMMDIDLYCRELTNISNNTKSRGNKHSAKVLEHHIALGQRHLGLINKFDRYPQRNAVLDRESTPEELEYLKKPDAKIDF